MQEAHKRIGVPKLVEALCDHVTTISVTPVISQADAGYFVASMMLAAHGATLMKLAGAPESAINHHLSGFCQSLHSIPPVEKQ